MWDRQEIHHFLNTSFLLCWKTNWRKRVRVERTDDTSGAVRRF